MSDRMHMKEVPLEDVLRGSFEPMSDDVRDRVRTRVMTGIDAESRFDRARTLFMRSAAAFAATATLMAGTGYAAANSLPGDPLYEVKRAAEEIRIVFSSDAQQGETLMRLTRERTREVRQLVESDADESDLRSAAKGFGEAADRAVRSQPDSASAEQTAMQIQDAVAQEPDAVQQRVEQMVPSSASEPAAVQPNAAPSSGPGPAQPQESQVQEPKVDPSEAPVPDSPGPGEPASGDSVPGKGR